jgi:hypothetical protein
MYIYQKMDEYDVPMGIPLFSTPPTFIRGDQVVPRHLIYPNERLYKAKPGDSQEMIDKINAILSMKDEDEINGKIEAKAKAAELKERNRQERERLKFEEMRLRNEDKKAAKYKKRCNEIRKLLIKIGFTEDDCKRLCGSCKLPCPYDISYREIDTSTPTGFSLNCKHCEKNCKAKQFDLITGEEITEGVSNDRSKIHRMTHAFNNKCKCGKIFVVSDIAGLDDANYRKHIRSAYHQQWESIYLHQTSLTNVNIKFELFSISQLRTIIKNNKNDKGKLLVLNYSKKNKEEIIKVLKEVKSRLNIDYSLLPEPKNKDKTIGYVNQGLQQDYIEELHFSSDDEEESKESSSEEDSD